LKQCIGVEGFFLVVKNTPEISFDPIWWSTCQEIDDFLVMLARGSDFDISVCLAKMEGFATAGCDASGAPF
jgi:hypothetical protein